MAKQKILIVDDEPLELALFVQLCEGQPWEIITAEDGKKALEILCGQKIDLAIVDLYLPEMNGLTILKQAKLQGIQTPMIIMSGYSSMKNGGNAIRSGAVDVLDKPFKKDDFLDMLKKYLLPSNAWSSWLDTFLWEHYPDASLSIKNVMQHFRLSSRSHTSGLFKKHLGENFLKRLKEIRLENARAFVVETTLPFNEIADMCGFKSQSRLNDAFKEKYGMAPGDYRKTQT